MKVAIIGSRTLRIENLGDYLPENVTEIISGGAVGVDTCAREYAKKTILFSLPSSYPITINMANPLLSDEILK